jgi:hypothetical protein
LGGFLADRSAARKEEEGNCSTRGLVTTFGSLSLPDCRSELISHLTKRALLEFVEMLQKEEARR